MKFSSLFGWFKVIFSSWKSYSIFWNHFYLLFIPKNVGKSAFRSIWSLLYHLNTKHSSYRLETKTCCNTYETKHSSAPKLQLTPIAMICSCFISSTHSFFEFSFSYVSLLWCKISSLSQSWFSKQVTKGVSACAWASNQTSKEMEYGKYYVLTDLLSSIRPAFHTWPEYKPPQDKFNAKGSMQFA